MDRRCRFARVNAHGVAVSISLRGPNCALDVSPEKAAGWPLEAGDCADFAPPRSPFACEDRSDEGFYVNCHDHATFDARGHDGRRDTFHEVITTFVTRSQAAEKPGSMTQFPPA